LKPPSYIQELEDYDLISVKRADSADGELSFITEVYIRCHIMSIYQARASNETAQGRQFCKKPTIPF